MTLGATAGGFARDELHVGAVHHEEFPVAGRFAETGLSLEHCDDRRGNGARELRKPLANEDRTDREFRTGLADFGNGEIIRVDYAVREAMIWFWS